MNGNEQNGIGFEGSVQVFWCDTGLPVLFGRGGKGLGSLDSLSLTRKVHHKARSLLAVNVAPPSARALLRVRHQSSARRQRRKSSFVHPSFDVALLVAVCAMHHYGAIATDESTVLGARGSLSVI